MAGKRAEWEDAIDDMHAATTGGCRCYRVPDEDCQRLRDKAHASVKQALGTLQAEVDRLVEVNAELHEEI